MTDNNTLYYNKIVNYINITTNILYCKNILFNQDSENISLLKIDYKS